MNRTLKTDNGKLLLYASATTAPKQRLRSVKTATETMAKQLKMGFEVVPQSRGSQIYVYYMQGTEEPVPIYCDEGKNGDLQEILGRLRNMMFVLSFHPKHTALKQVRGTIIKLS